MRLAALLLDGILVDRCVSVCVSQRHSLWKGLVSLGTPLFGSGSVVYFKFTAVPAAEARKLEVCLNGKLHIMHLCLRLQHVHGPIHGPIDGS